MFNEFEKLKNNINSINENSLDRLKSIVENIDIDNNNFNDWVDLIFSDKVYELNINMVPYLIDELYTTTDRYKFRLCCMLLETLCKEVPFITNLAQHEIFKEKYLDLKSTLVEVSSRVYNGISDCMYLIILRNDPKGKLFVKEEKVKLISSINIKLEKLIEILTMDKEITEEVYYSLEILLDIAAYINDNITKEHVKRISSLSLNKSATLFLLQFEALNNMPLTKEKVENIMVNDQEYLYKLLNIFESIKKVNMLPLEKINQQQIAKSCLNNWLKYPTELGKLPDEIEFVDTFIRYDMVYYIFKFKSDIFPDKGYMLGITGGYKKDSLRAYNIGHTFSSFETLTDDYLTQANKIIDTIMQYWQ